MSSSTFSQALRTSPTKPPRALSTWTSTYSSPVAFSSTRKRTDPSGATATSILNAPRRMGMALETPSPSGENPYAASFSAFGVLYRKIGSMSIMPTRLLRLKRLYIPRRPARSVRFQSSLLSRGCSPCCRWRPQKCQSCARPKWTRFSTGCR